MKVPKDTESVAASEKKKLLKSPRLIKYNNDGKNTWMFPKLYFIMKALHIRAVISNGHYANELIPSHTHWEIGNMRHKNNKKKEWKFGYGIYQKYIFHFFLALMGRWSTMMLYLSVTRLCRKPH